MGCLIPAAAKTVREAGEGEWEKGERDEEGDRERLEVNQGGNAWMEGGTWGGRGSEDEVRKNE